MRKMARSSHQGAATGVRPATTRQSRFADELLGVGESGLRLNVPMTGKYTIPPGTSRPVSAIKDRKVRTTDLPRFGVRGHWPIRRNAHVRVEPLRRSAAIRIAIRPFLPSELACEWILYKIPRAGLALRMRDSRSDGVNLRLFYRTKIGYTQIDVIYLTDSQNGSRAALLGWRPNAC